MIQGHAGNKQKVKNSIRSDSLYHNGVQVHSGQLDT